MIFDTSALVKRYHLETGSDRVNEIFDDPDSVLIISELAIVELTSALQRRRNRGEITPATMNNALAAFAASVLNELIVAGFRSGFVQRAKDLIIQHNLRTMDGLQLTVALEFSLLSPVFVCADDRLLLAAEAAGLAILNPQTVP